MRTLTMEGTAGRDGGPEPRDEAGSGAPAAAVPWYSPHTVTELTVFVHPKWKPEEQGFEGEIYPFGVMLKNLDAKYSKPPVGCGRGAINEFTHEAARRLREAFLTLHVPGFDLWAITLTSRKSFTAAQWREVTMRFSQGVKRAGWAGLWRGELQKRKARHAHVALSLPPGTGKTAVRDLWLRCTGEEDDPAARRVAVHGRLSNDEAGWGVYITLHATKHKEEQLGWDGKQWGIWNRALLQKREPVRFKLTVEQHKEFLRLLHVEAFNQRLHQEEAAAEKKVQKCCGQLEAHRVKVTPYIRELVREGFERGIPLGPPWVKDLHCGNLLRCVEGAIVARILSEVTGVKVDANST